MGFDSIVANPGRLSILTALAGGAAREFVEIRSATHLTDGNLCSHARRLEGAGLIEIHKAFRGGKPLTTMRLTARGMEALRGHARSILESIEGSVRVEEAMVEEEWVD